MAAEFLKKKQSDSFGLNYTGKIRPSNPPYRQLLPGTFPWQDKATQTELSLIMDSEKTLAILTSLKEELMAVREELRLSKKFLQSEYEVLLTNKATELTRRVNEGLFYLENLYRERVESIKHAFRQQVADMLAKDLPQPKEEEEPEVDEVSFVLEDSSNLKEELEQLKKTEVELRKQLQNREEQIEKLGERLVQYTRQQQHLMNIQHQHQRRVIYLEERQRQLENEMTPLPPAYEGEDNVEREYQLAKLGEMHQLKVKHQSEAKTMYQEIDKIKNLNVELQKTLDMKELQLTTYGLEMSRMREQQKEDQEDLATVNQQLSEVKQMLDNERTDFLKTIADLKNKIAQEAERQEKRRKWQQFLQDPSKTGKDSTATSLIAVTPEKLKEDITRLLENEWPVAVLEKVIETMTKALEEGDVSPSGSMSGANK